MNKQELIDKAVEELNGNFKPAQGSGYFVADGYLCSLCDNDKYHYQRICDEDDFNQRSLELGWINGYKYGVEYQTNGKKPDLPDDVVIECFDGVEWWGGYDYNAEELLRVKELKFDTAVTQKFRIVDRRYKPLNIPPAPEQPVYKQPAEPKQDDRFARGELPPVGAFVDVVGEVRYGAGESNCEVIAHVENCAVIRMSWGLGCFENHCLKPAKSERDKFIEAAIKMVTPEGSEMISTNTASNWFGKLYDAGFRAPK